jgi:ribosomal protein S16
MAAEVLHRTAGRKEADNWELYDYLSARSEGHRQAADALGQLSPSGVDAHVTAYADRAQTWHEEGAELYARAKELLTAAPTAQLGGPAAQSWQNAATQHQMEERLLAEKHQAVRTYLEHQQASAIGQRTAAQ